MDKLYDYIIERLPDIEGYGNVGRVYDEDGVSNHSVFKQSIREDKQGDIGVFITNTHEATKLSGHSFWVSEVQIVVNTVNGDVECALRYLRSLYNNIQNNSHNDYIWIKNSRLINICPVGKNSSGIHWCVLNVQLKYIINEDN